MFEARKFEVFRCVVLVLIAKIALEVPPVGMLAILILKPYVLMVFKAALVFFILKLFVLEFRIDHRIGHLFFIKNKFSAHLQHF